MNTFLDYLYQINSKLLHSFCLKYPLLCYFKCMYLLQLNRFNNKKYSELLEVKVDFKYTHIQIN